MDKMKVQSIQNRINKTMAQTSAPSIDDDSKPTPEVAGAAPRSVLKVWNF